MPAPEISVHRFLGAAIKKAPHSEECDAF